MATVPVAQRRVRIERSRPVFQQNQSIPLPGAAFGVGTDPLAGVAQAAGQVGDQLAQVALQQARDDNAKKVKQLALEYQGFIREQGFGTAQRPGGYYTQRGETAVGARPGFEEAIQRRRAELLSGLENNPELMAEVDLRTGALLERELESSAKYFERERVVAVDDTINSRIENAASNAGQYILLPDGMKRLAQELIVASNEADQKADLQGAGSDGRLALRTDAQTQVVRAAFDRAVEEHPQLAEQILNQYRGAVDGRIIDNMESDLAVGALRQRSLIEATALEGEFTTLTEKIDAAKKKFGDDARLLDAVTDRLRLNERVSRDAQRQQQDQVDQAVWQHALSGRDPRELPPSVQNNASRTELQAAVSHYKDELQGRGFGEFDDPVVINELETSGRGLADINLLQKKYVRGLTGPTWQRIQSKQQTLLSASDSEKGAIMSIDQVRNNAASRFGLKGSNAAKFKALLDDQFSEFKGNTGRWPNNEEARSIADAMGTEFTTSREGGLFNIFGSTTSVTLRSASPEQRGNIDLTDVIEVPAQDRNDDIIAGVLNISPAQVPVVLRNHPEGAPLTVGELEKTINEMIGRARMRRGQ